MFICVVISIAAPSLWAGEIPAPSSVILNSRNQLLLANYLGRDDDGRFRFASIEDLRGSDKTSEEIRLRAPAWLISWLAKGERYLLVYSNYTSNPRFRKDYLVDTDGPHLVSTVGLEPAIFRDSASWRVALLDALDHSKTGDDKFAAEAIAGLLGTDTQIQNFYAAELTQREDWHDRPSVEMVQAIKTVLGNSDAHPSARTALLRLALAQADIYGRDDLLQVITGILQSAPLIGYQDPRPQPGELVVAALQAAREQALAVPFAALDRLVLCDSAALSEEALLTIRSLDPEREQHVLDTALQQTQLPAITREFLLDHVRRLNLMRGPTTSTATELR